MGGPTGHGSGAGGAVFQVGGTTGQSDVRSMSGGPFSVIGGLLGIIAVVQRPGPPLLSILNTPTNAVLLTWPSSSAGFELQQNNGLTTPNWTQVEFKVADDGTTKSVLVAPAAGNRFFRLKYPQRHLAERCHIAQSLLASLLRLHLLHELDSGNSG